MSTVTDWHWPSSWAPTWSDEMLDSDDCTLSLDNLFFEKPIIHKVWVQRDAPHHPLSLLPSLSAEGMYFPPLFCIWQKATAPGVLSMAAGGASISFSDSSHSGYAGGGRLSLYSIQYVVLWIRVNSFSLDLSKLLGIGPIEALLNLTVWLTDTIAWIGLKAFPIFPGLRKQTGIWVLWYIHIIISMTGMLNLLL